MLSPFQRTFHILINITPSSVNKFLANFILEYIILNQLIWYLPLEFELVINLLLSKEILTSDEVENIKEKAELDIKNTWYDFYKVQDIDNF